MAERLSPQQTYECGHQESCKIKLIAKKIREENVKNGKQSTIIFIRYKESKNKEISAYIDFRERLKSSKTIYKPNKIIKVSTTALYAFIPIFTP